MSIMSRFLNFLTGYQDSLIPDTDLSDRIEMERRQRQVEIRLRLLQQATGIFVPEDGEDDRRDN